VENLWKCAEFLWS